MNKNSYQVIVGNVGCVYDGHNSKIAKSTFREYKRISKSGVGRAGHEPVYLIKNDETENEYYPKFNSTTEL